MPAAFRFNWDSPAGFALLWPVLIIRLHDYRVGGLPEGVTCNVQSPERDRLWLGRHQ